MRIAFDVLPLIGCRMTGIGYCEAGQIQALTRLYPDDEFLLQFFSRKNEEIKIQRLQPYLRENVKSRPSFARDLSSSKDFVREFFQREEKTPEHLSGYEGYDSRQMAKMAHLEPLRDGTYLLFDYKKRDPLSYNARTVRV